MEIFLNGYKERLENAERFIFMKRTIFSKELSGWKSRIVEERYTKSQRYFLSLFRGKAKQSRRKEEEKRRKKWGLSSKKRPKGAVSRSKGEFHP